MVPLSQAEVQSNNEANFFDNLDMNNKENVEINDGSEETIISVLNSFNKGKSSMLESLENRLATTYGVVSLFDRQFSYTKELYNKFPEQIRVLEDEWQKVEVGIQKKIEEMWNVSKTKELVDKYYEIIVNQFDEMFDIDHEKLIMMLSMPPYDDFSYKRDAELFWCQRIIIDLTRQFLRSRGALFSEKVSEYCYRTEIVDPLLAGSFEMIERSIWLEIGEIENEVQKLQRNDTKEDKERSKLGMKHDGVVNIIVQGKKYQVGFLEVVGNAFNKDITDRNVDLEKLYKGIPIAIRYLV